MSKGLYFNLNSLNRHLSELRKQLKNYFSFSRTEVNGLMILIPLIVFLLFSPYLYRQFFGIDYNTLEEDQRLLDSLVASINSGLEKRPETMVVEYFDFDPNKSSVEEFMRLGVPKFLSLRISNYRNKGGKFRIKSDLLKIFDFPDTLYRQLAPHIKLPIAYNKDVKNSKGVEKKKERGDEQRVVSKKVLPKKVIIKKELVKIDINEADTTLLKSLKGIGSSYSKRIVAYRKLLGGYHDVSQLREVYGMSDSLFNSISPYLLNPNSDSLTKLPINLATFKEILAHPYISYEQTKEILNTKSRFGKFLRSEDLYRLKLMDSVEINRLLPYLIF